MLLTGPDLILLTESLQAQQTEFLLNRKGKSTVQYNGTVQPYEYSGTYYSCSTTAVRARVRLGTLY